MLSKIIRQVLLLKAKDVKIGNKIIGYDNPTYFIAEAGVNHNGKIELCLEMIEEAQKAGADAIKFQTFKASQVCLPKTATTSYQKKNTGRTNQQTLLKSLELNEKFYPVLQKKCQDLKIDFLSTPHGHIKSAKFLNKLNVPVFKISSADITNLPFLSYLANLKKLVLLSTGTVTLEEINQALTLFDKKKCPVVVMHCVTAYPTPAREANIGAILDLYRTFPDKLIGYSDHTVLPESLLMAAGFGASVLEAHFTLDKNLAGPDQKNSFNPNQLKKIIQKIHTIEKIIGSGFKIPGRSELINAPLVRKSITTTKSIKKGEFLNENNLTIRRPESGGVLPKFWWKIIGRKASKKLPADYQLKKGDWQ